MTARHDDGVRTRVRTTGWLDLPGDEVAPVAAELVYRSSDCFAVTMELRGPDGVVVAWTFAWELLGRGLLHPAGEGDVRVAPGPGASPMVEVVLATSFGARVRFPARDVGYFVSKAGALAASDRASVPRDLDLELATIMGEAEPA